jgi:tRNA threonylcarbamoyladenosine biosynthesis protein TsaB
MKILGIDTSTKFLCLGVACGQKVYEYNLEVGAKLSSLLAPTIERVLNNLGWGFEDIDYFACGLGPGSFTGIRVGLATVKGLSWSMKKPVVGISTLDILASNVKEEGIVVPAVDAKRKLIYCSFYKVKDKTIKRLKPYLLLNEKEFLDKIKEIYRQKQSKIIVVGDALALYRQDIQGAAREIISKEIDYWYPQPRNLIALAKEKIETKKITDSFGVRPTYLYPKECQIRPQATGF